MVPGEIKEARVNSRKNVVANHANTPTAESILLITPTLCGTAIRAYVLRGRQTIVGVIQGVDCSIPNSELGDHISSTTSAIEVLRFVTSQRTKIVFKGNCLHTTVKVGLVHHPVTPLRAPAAAVLNLLEASPCGWCLSL